MFKRNTRKLAFVILAAMSLLPAQSVVAQATDGWTLDSALQQLSRQAESLETAYGLTSLAWKDSAGAVTRSGSGIFFMNRNGELRFDATEPEQRTVLVSDGTVYIYEPERALVEEFRLSQHPERLEPYAMLGFSSTGERLERDYLVTLRGEETLDNQRTLVLELTPKEGEARTAVARMTLWIDQASWIPVRQEIVHTASGETLSVSHSQMARNVSLNRDLFAARWPSGVERVRR